MATNIKKKVHPIAAKLGYKSNQDFYNDYPTQQHFEAAQNQQGAQLQPQQGAIMADGGNVSPEERLAYNNYTKSLLQGNRLDYGNVGQDTGFNPSRVPAIQQDLAIRNNTMPGSVHNRSDGTMGYITYKYQRADTIGNIYNSIDRGTEPFTQSQMNNWGNPNIAYNQPTPSIQAQPTLNSAQPLQRATTNKQSFYSPGTIDYSVDNVRQSENLAMSRGGITKKRIMAQGGLNYMDGGGFSADIPINLNSAPLIGGLDALVTAGIYNPQIRGNEANLMRKSMQPIQSPGNFNGDDMLAYAGGGLINQYNTSPMDASQMIEGGEYVQMPNGQGDTAVGDKHWMASGGIPTNLPEDSRVYSEQLKAPKDFVKAITDSKIRKKMSYADLAQKFDTSKHDDILRSPTSDPIAKRSAGINMAFLQDKQNQVFDHQEMMKNPQLDMQQEYMGRGGIIKKYIIILTFFSCNQ